MLKMGQIYIPVIFCRIMIWFTRGLRGKIQNIWVWALFPAHSSLRIPRYSLLPPCTIPLGRSSQCTSPKHPVSCVEPGLAIRFIYDIIHVSMPFSQIIPPSPSPTDSKRLFYTSVSLLLSYIQGYHYHLSKFHIYVLVYCIGVFLSGLLHSV